MVRDLHHIVYPVMVKGKQFGSVLAGPFLMEEPDETLAEDMEVSGRITRDRVKIMVGGAPVTQEFADSIGADAYTEDAPSAAEKALELLAG